MVGADEDDPSDARNLFPQMLIERFQVSFDQEMVRQNRSRHPFRNGGWFSGGNQES